MALSGWCSGPTNAIPKCAECVSLLCFHSCHDDQTCGGCLASRTSAEHHAACVAPLDQLTGEVPC